MRFRVYIKLFTAVLVAATALHSCKPEESYPPTPELTFESFDKIKRENGKDSIVTLHLTFRDGDGDIGLTSQDSFPPFAYGQPYFYNLLVDFYSIENGVEKKLTSPFIVPDSLYRDTVQYHQRINNLTPEGRNKAIKGRLDLLTPFFIIDLSAGAPDSVRYKITLIDRKLNRSNQVVTPDIQLDL
ncbi:MAG TPA: hypothetical protein VEC12_12700 [Bacteroidia bacterium]|nr:hypothetical protein [Bacteroidia bacterium]